MKIRTIIAIGIFSLCFTASSVYAAWVYSSPILPSELPTAVQMGAWQPSVVLPSTEGGISGTDHDTMIQQILNNSNSGLNPKPQVLLNAVKNEKKNPYARQGLFYSELEKVTGGNLKFLFQANIVNIDFVMQTVTENQAYNFYTYLAPTATELNTTITAYKTVIEKINGEWVATMTYEGRAPVKQFSSSGGSFYAVDHTKWVNT